VVTQDGTVWFLYGALRGKAIIMPERGTLPGGWRNWPFPYTVVPAAEVRPNKNPAAQLLGRQKAGVVERKSQAKARAARLNGLKPTRPGHRRGRRPAPSCGAATLASVARSDPDLFNEANQNLRQG
jgi:hypothetical protein